MSLRNTIFVPILNSFLGSASDSNVAFQWRLAVFKANNHASPLVPSAYNGFSFKARINISVAGFACQMEYGGRLRNDCVNCGLPSDHQEVRC
jgi:hypothetical protein